MAVGLGVLLLNVDLLNSKKPTTAATTAEFLTRSCFEEALHRLKSNHSFTGTVAIGALANPDCTAQITTESGPEVVKLISIEAKPNGYQVQTERRVKIVDGKFELLQ